MQLAPTQRVPVSMPDTGYSHVGALVHWSKRPGEPVEAGEPLGLVEVDIADFDLIAPASGTLAELLVEPGEAVAVGQRLADFAPRRRGPLAVLARGSQRPRLPRPPRRTRSVTRERGASDDYLAARLRAQESGASSA